MGSLEEHLLNVHVILISASAWFILWTLRRVWSEIDTNHWLSRYKPLYPAIICQAFVWIPGTLPAQQDPTIGYRILIGFWCGFLSSIGYQIVKRVLLPKGIKLPDRPEDLFSRPSGNENLGNTRKETPTALEGTGRKAFTPINTDDLFKPPKM